LALKGVIFDKWICFWFYKRVSNLNDQFRRVNNQPPMLGPLTIRDAEATASKQSSVY